MTEPQLHTVSIKDVRCGEDVVIIQPSNLYDCALDDNVFVGPFVEIQRGVSIGARTRIQSHSFICEGVTISSDCFIAHGVTFVNDLFKNGSASQDARDWKKTIIASHVSIGSGATILPVSICSHVVIGAGSVVTKNIAQPGIYAGNPARFIRPLSNG
jgi:acetyltransferase-like isoleucine patch superfamily enzyme